MAESPGVALPDFVGSEITERFRAEDVWRAIAETNPHDLRPKDLEPLLFGLLEEQGRVREVVGFFRCGEELVEWGAGETIEALRLVDPLSPLGVQSLGPPVCDLHPVRTLMGTVWGEGDHDRLYALASATPFGQGLAPAGHGVWICMNLSAGERASLALVSANTGMLIVMAPVRFNGVAFTGIALALKIACLLILILAAKILAPTGWGAVAAVLGILLMILLILLELAKIAQKAWQGGGAGGGGGPVVANPFDAYVKRLEKTKERAEKLKKKMDERAGRIDKFDPLDPDNTELQKIFDDLNKDIEDGEKDGALTPEQRKELEGYSEDARKLAPK